MCILSTLYHIEFRMNSVHIGTQAKTLDEQEITQ